MVLVQYQRVDKFQLAHANKQNVFRCILNEGPINKSAIAQKIGITIPSVMKIVDSLLESGLVRSVGKGVSSGGKPPEMLEAVANSHYAIGVDIGLSEIRIALGNMKKEIVARRTMQSCSNLTVDDMVELLSENIRDVIDNSDIDKNLLLGIGLGAPGLIDMNTGRIVFSPHFRWENVDLCGKLAERIPEYPILIDNVTRNSARAECELGAGKGVDNLFMLNLGRGIASAFMLGSSIYCGTNGMCGEIGHLTVNREGPMCMCGDYGCLEALASGEAIAEQAKNVIGRGVESKILELVDGKIENIEAKVVFEAGELGDQAAMMIIERALDYIGIAVAGVINLLDVERVVLTGGMTKNGDLFWNTIKRDINAHLMKYSGTSAEIVSAMLGDDAAALGAICKVIHQYLIML